MNGVAVQTHLKQLSECDCSQLWLVLHSAAFGVNDLTQFYQLLEHLNVGFHPPVFG